MEEKKEISLEEIMDRLDDTVTQMENDGKENKKQPALLLT